MKTILSISRFVVGVLFIFSGLIKANDPLGLSYKMQEFFEVWNLHALNEYTLVFAVIMISFEIIAGVAVLLGWRMNLFIWLLLLLILFFTFLTGYALFSGKIRECGCFGDCIPLQANQSFIKDLVLLVLILVIFPFRKKIIPWLRPSTSFVILFFTVVFSVALQLHVLHHLPLVDCLPYKVGNNLPEKMQAPPGSIPDSTVILFTYEKNGQPVSFTAEEFPEDFDDSYVFVKREDKIVRKGTAMPAIRDFSLQTVNGNDTTQQLLTEPGPNLFLFVKNGYKKGEWVEMMDVLMQEAGRKGMKGFLVTNLEVVGQSGGVASQNATVAQLVPQLLPLRADGTAIKTAARYNPTLFLIDGGTIVGKWSAPNFDRALKKISEWSPQ